ncbi:MAG TPA: septal ring lytic transglycosylase RlpA family protein [Chitinophagales bacterium]|nr:septal ring lytic transglycosylase RlpA family protein [Chitinophagales bacterium]
MSRLSAQTPYDTTGKASYYAKEFHGRQTANGEIFSNNKYTCAHRTLPFGTKLKVTNISNGKWCEVVVNDRGPYSKGRIIDLSKKAASDLDFVHAGLATVRVEEITPENACALVHRHDTIAPTVFPQAWRGNWCGVLEIFNATGKRMSVPMKLIVQPTLDSTRWQWVIVYDTSTRAYELVTSGDSTKRSYSIDEKNGIVLPAALMGNTLVSSFEVQGNRIDAMYKLHYGEIHFTILSVTSNALVQTGLGTSDSPQVNAFAPTSYQTAVLTRNP